MPLDDSLGDGQTHAGAFVLVLRIEPLEESEQAAE
jgi:hypothetical protein